MNPDICVVMRLIKLCHADKASRGPEASLRLTHRSPLGRLVEKPVREARPWRRLTTRPSGNVEMEWCKKRGLVSVSGTKNPVFSLSSCLE